VWNGRDVKECLPKEQMFPALLDKIKTYLGDEEAPVGNLKSA
jgi:hypothetical protein